MPLTLPPLNSLRAFEAAARTGSYVAAAAELSVSPAAISQHIRKLEEFLGKDMFLRLNNRVVLTDAGQAIFAGTAEALLQISQTTLDLTAPRIRARLVISVLESLAETWLVPRLMAYARLHPDFRFDLRIEPDPIDFAGQDVDLRLSYGLAHYPDLQVQVLAQDEVQPMCSPQYLQQNPKLAQGGMAQVPGGDLLHTSWGPGFGSNPGWQSWFQRAGLPPPDLTGSQVGRSALALDLARGGMGVALAQRLLARADLEAGRLVPLSEVSLPLGHPYCLVRPHSKARKRSLTAFADWLMRQA